MRGSKLHQTPGGRVEEGHSDIWSSYVDGLSCQFINSITKASGAGRWKAGQPSTPIPSAAR